MSSVVRLIFPHQLFADNLKADKRTVFVLIEDDLFFKQYRFHKQKLILHRASMRYFHDRLEGEGHKVEYIETGANDSMAALKRLLEKLKPSMLSHYELTDNWLEKRLAKATKELSISVERLESPGFLTSRGAIEEFFENNQNRMQYFYIWQRRRLGIMIDNDKPVGGKWSFDADNRKKLPKGAVLPPDYKTRKSPYADEAITYVERLFPDNPGNSDTFAYPVTHSDAEERLTQFMSQRLSTFGPYEDAITKDEGQLFHSVLSPLLNCGLLTPRQVVDQVLAYAKDHEVPIESLEGFIRQVIGWREYMRATYLHFGSRMRTGNELGFTNKLKKGWWDGSTGIDPIDTVVHRVLRTSYAHHIERLMLIGNMMVLLRIDPDEVYEWFMSLFIDAYDWVMVPNVYAMSQYAAGSLITTKPYISGSNYVLKMSDHKKGDWMEVWDALYWKFIDDYRDMIRKNYRMQMVVTTYDKFDAAKKRHITAVAKDWIG